jgi:hypothetical protein
MPKNGGCCLWEHRNSITRTMRHLHCCNSCTRNPANRQIPTCSGPAEGWEAERWQLRAANELLNLKICDIAKKPLDQVMIHFCKLCRGHCSAFPVSEEVFLAPVARMATFLFRVSVPTSRKPLVLLVKDSLQVRISLFNQMEHSAVLQIIL